MNNIAYAVVPTINALPECWIYADRNYTYMSGRNQLPLPIVSGAQTSLLDKLNIPYREMCSNVFEMWDPSCFKQVTKTLPVYVRQGSEYRYVSKKTGAFLSEETRKRAFELYDSTVKPELERLKQLENQKKIAKYLDDLMDGATAYGLDYTDERLLKDAYSGMHIKTFDKNFRIFPVYASNNRETNYIAVFDLTKFVVGDTVEMKVPAGVEALFIGRSGWQVKEWCSKFGLTKINVKPI